jgi:hypothetical protein
MDIAFIFDWLAQDSLLAAELATDQTQHEGLAQIGVKCGRPPHERAATTERRRRSFTTE